jgi:hypothetical protein
MDLLPAWGKAPVLATSPDTTALEYSRRSVNLLRRCVASDRAQDFRSRQPGCPGSRAHPVRTTTETACNA